VIIVNFKTYPESTGVRALELARKLQVVAEEAGVSVVVCPQAVDFQKISEIGIETWAQNIDPEERGRATGWFPPEIAKEAGAVGTLLNHSEHKLGFEFLKTTCARAKEVGLKTLVFAASVDEAKKVAELRPDYIGYEPPELIASPDTSVARSKPEVIRDVVDTVSIPVVVGAGVKNAQDVKTSLELGAVGVALSSALVGSENPGVLAKELARAFKP